ncbi:Carbon monoxide dehydrogenase [Hyphomicrobium sp. 1Nfss2.1]|uniref:SRPBCC family protein n=1 Tax=Hyphomicrobium sp. 1Nfss2.1 TaxID=3413936 RepID=UPI003C7B9BED
MKINQSFEVNRPPAEVWALFQDIPTVATCMPGAQFTEDRGDGNYAGRVNIKLGPFGASFEGAARVVNDAATHSAHVEGQGLDRKGGSRSKLIMDYKVVQAGVGSRVDIEADVQLAGPIAQFGRTGVITETANVLIGQFARNVEAKLSEVQPQCSASQTAASTSSAAAEPAQAANQVNAFRILWLVFVSSLRRMFGMQSRQGS